MSLYHSLKQLKFRQCALVPFVFLMTREYEVSCKLVSKGRGPRGRLLNFGLIYPAVLGDEMCAHGRGRVATVAVSRSFLFRVGVYGARVKHLRPCKSKSVHICAYTCTM